VKKMDEEEEQQIYFLLDYNWSRGVLKKTNKKTYKIQEFLGHTRNVSKEKCAFPDEEVCIVWDTRKGVNGRGSYRVEREAYPTDRIPANKIAHQHWQGAGRVTE